MEIIDNNPFKQAGVVLLAIGLVDIAIFVYCISNEISYSSSFNIFSVVAGIYLLKRSVKTARLVRWFSVFFVVGMIGTVMITLITTPFTLLSLQIKLNLSYWLGSLFILLILSSVLVWVYIQLSMPSSLSLFKEAGYKVGKPVSAYASGVALIVLLIVMSSLMLNGEPANKARKLAEGQLGNGYLYHVSNIQMSGETGNAVVIAYNDNEIKNIKVAW